MKNIFLFGVLVLAVFFAPSHTQAYYTTDQQAFTVDNHMAVYTIEYSFGHSKHDVWMPISAQRGTEAARTAVSYEMHDEDGKPLQGDTTAIVLSTAKVEDGMYVTPRGKAASFTLLVFYTPHADEKSVPAHLQVIHLPFSFDKTQNLQLNPSELTHYKSPEVTLYKPLFVFPESTTFTITK